MIVIVIGCPSRIAAPHIVAAPTNCRHARRAAAVSAREDHHRRRGALRAYVYVRGRRGGVQPGGVSWYAAHLQTSGGGWSTAIPAASSGRRSSGGQFLKLCTAMSAMARACPSRQCPHDCWCQSPSECFPEERSYIGWWPSRGGSGGGGMASAATMVAGARKRRGGPLRISRFLLSLLTLSVSCAAHNQGMHSTNGKYKIPPI